jgi:hypothetical protein
MELTDLAFVTKARLGDADAFRALVERYGRPLFRPGGEPRNIPLLIEMAKTTQNAGVRRQAMSSLAQSRDPRVLAFFEDVLKR